MTLQAIECLTALIGSGALFTAAGGLLSPPLPASPITARSSGTQRPRQALTPAAPHQRGAHDAKVPVCRAWGERMGGVGRAAAHQRIVGRPPGLWRGLGDRAALCCPLPGGAEPCGLRAAPGCHWSASRTRYVAFPPEQATVSFRATGCRSDGRLAAAAAEQVVLLDLSGQCRRCALDSDPGSDCRRKLSDADKVVEDGWPHAGGAQQLRNAPPHAEPRLGEGQEQQPGLPETHPRGAACPHPVSGGDGAQARRLVSPACYRLPATTALIPAVSAVLLEEEQQGQRVPIQCLCQMRGVKVESTSVSARQRSSEGDVCLQMHSRAAGWLAVPGEGSPVGGRRGAVW